MTDQGDSPDAPEQGDDAQMRRAAYLSRIVVLVISAIFTLGIGVWLVQAFLTIQPTEVGGSRLAALLAFLGNNILDTGLPVLLAVLIAVFSGLLANLALGDVAKRSTFQLVDAFFDAGVFGARLRLGQKDPSPAEVDAAALTRLRARIRTLNRKNRELSDRIESLETPAGLFYSMCRRLEAERLRLSRNSRTNLLIGIVASLIALVVLGLPLIRPEVVSGDESILNANFWRQYATRLPVGVLLQFVAFFFLRLYVSCEMDIKSNKNEVTNIESRYFAYVIASNHSAENLGQIVSSLASTERNFILKRGERTISIENDSRFNDMKETLDKMIDAFGAVMGKKAAE